MMDTLNANRSLFVHGVVYSRIKSAKCIAKYIPLLEFISRLRRARYHAIDRVEEIATAASKTHLNWDLIYYNNNDVSDVNLC